ncbi:MULTISPECIES: DUF4292 domain-containing protein [unclassified Mucilaginibacter]|jgi:hypothetical protein|uniref:DUF4292 domain-containing protein n=1 Tax=unclassified Mucilaginibacter TaxID=2617802 RepID=UPI0008BAF2F4|nr:MULTISPECIES: DUF4292 domain-containing protein [unclassified Mucilaginibacter]WDF76987.1 DUF4292 domain-containing protein [Mucilaginibacter sp. KACC 22773]SEO26110.1 protein of unknown function [Mucilaginibacter sp. OK283]
MKKNILNRLLIVCGLLAIVSCKARKQVMVARKADVVATPDNKINTKLAAIKAQQVNFNTFSGKAKTNLDINGNSNDVTLNIRINKGKKIWVSITAILGVEVARAVITPDSILLINRLEGVYLKKPFSYVYAYASKQVNYKTLESLLIGNAIPELLTENADFTTVNGNTTLSGTLDDLLYKLIVGADNKVTQTNLNSQSEGQSLQVANNTFIQANNRILPSQIDIASTVKDKNIHVNLHYTRVDFDQQQEYPFSIPDRYEPAK